MNNISKEKIEQFQKKVRGPIVLPDNSDFDEVRKIWNAMIDRRPAIIVQCLDADDVSHAVLFAQQNGLEVSIRGVGHNIAGNAVCEGGMMIDFSTMKKVDVDPTKRRATVEPGATLGDFDEATQMHGLATPVGINSTTGISGLTLGGGFGWLTRKYGMTIDNLLSVDMVTLDGKKIRASKDENTDLFWAVRGGGGNFGVVTRYEFNLHSVGPDIFAGLIVFPYEQATQVLTKWRNFVKSTPEELSVWVVLRKAPPLPFLPETVHGKEVVVLPIFYAGNATQGDKLIAPIRNWGSPVGEHIGTQPYKDWQKAFDPLLTPGARNYWKSHNFREISDNALNVMIEYAGKLPTPQCEIFIAHVSGAPNRIQTDAMAYSNRDANFILNVHARWDDAAEDGNSITWARMFFKASAPYASDGVYVNFMTEDESDRVAAAYGVNHDRLVQIKNKYDPENILHLNQNIKPSL